MAPRTVASVAVSGAMALSSKTPKSAVRFSSPPASVMS